MLFRYDETDSFVGDTWHATLEDAKSLAANEYQIGLEDWTETDENA